MKRSWYFPHRAKAVIGLLGLVCVLLLGKVAYIQGWRREHWVQTVPRSSGDEKELRGFRGRILDRNGTPLAQTVLKAKIVASGKEVCKWALDAQQYQDSKLNAARLTNNPKLRRVAKLIALTLDIDAEQVLGRLCSPSDPHVVLAQNVNVEQAEDLIAALRELDCRGIQREPQTCRYYPHGTLASAVIGYCRQPEHPRNDIQYGAREWPADGVERQFRAISAGEAMVLGDRYDEWGRRILRPRMGSRPTAAPGKDLVLTIDFSVQEVVEQALDTCWDERHPVGANAVVMGAQTGQILAMACRPTFDPNNITARPSGTSEADDDNGLKHLLNRPVIRAMEPGSTLKLLTVAAALEYGVIDRHSVYTCAGTESIGGEDLRCWGRWKHQGHGALTPKDILAKSCNICAAKIALDLGADRLCAFLRKCGIGQRPHAGFPNEFPQEPIAKLTRPGKLRARDVACLGFGQGVLVSDLQLAAAVTAIVNGGYYYQSHILRGFLGPMGRDAYEVEPRIVRSVCSEHTSRTMREFMRYVVEHGTGKVAHIPGYAVGGKTATAQIFDPEAGHWLTGAHNHLMSFVLVAPVDRSPDFVIVVSVERPAVGQYGSEVAGPVARQIARYLLQKPELFTENQSLPHQTVADSNPPTLG